jgi:peptidoglycan/LPS O-acetylase OafA/YrhL
MGKSLPALTGIRGIAAIWVILFHIGSGVPGFTLSPFLQRFALSADGFRGVDLFFVLSGFIIMHVHGTDFGVIRKNAVLHFAATRCLRIYPAHVATLLLILCAIVALPEYAAWARAWYETGQSTAYTLPSFIQTATLTTRWLVPDLGMWNSVTWSLSVELLAYATLPFLALWLGRTKSRALCLLLAFGSITLMLALLWAAGSHDGGSSNRPGLARGLFGFAAGAGMCRFAALTRPSDRQAGWAAGLAVLLMVILIELGLGFFVPFTFLVLITALAYRTGWVNTVLSSSPALFLGKISYSLYLVHSTPLLIMDWYYQTNQRDGTWVDIVAYFAFVLALSTAMHFGVERPAQRLTRSRRNVSIIVRQPAG